ncbi:MAG: hypothetical protein ACXWL2_01650 [Candidatus Chromulinivorax sp.]
MNKLEEFLYDGIPSPVEQASALHVVDSYVEQKQVLLSDQLYQAMLNCALQSATSLQKLHYDDFLTYAHRADLDISLLTAPLFVKLLEQAQQRLSDAIEQGVKGMQGKKIVHTAPHHDDILLGYHTYAVKNLEKNDTHVLYVTNGFRGVTDEYIADLLEQIDGIDQALLQGVVFTGSYKNCIKQFAQAFRGQDYEQLQEIRSLIFCIIVVQIFNCTDVQALFFELDRLRNFIQAENKDFFEVDFVKKYEACKGKVRASESDCKWMITAPELINQEKITHFNAQIYAKASDENFAADCLRLADYFKNMQPDIVTLLVDPCGVGPATHFQSYQMIIKALQLAGLHQVQIIGYRNVWSNFSVDQASIIVPIDSSDFKEVESIFTYCFACQVQPAFPSALYEGSFAAIAVQSMQHQAADVMTLTGMSDQQMSGAIFLQSITLG